MILLCVCKLCIAQTTYYVNPAGSDTNAGSAASPWQHITFGVNQLDPGETLIVQAGIYSEKVIIDGSLTGGASGMPITIQGDVGAIVDGSALSPNGTEALLEIVDAQYITVDNLELRNFSTSTGINITDTPIGIYIHGSAHNIIISNNIIHDIKNLSTCGQNSGCGPGANGIGVFGDDQNGLYDLEFYNNEIYNCVLAASEAFVLNGNIDRFTLMGNYVHDNNNIGFDFIGYEGICSNCVDPEDDRARNGLVKNNKAENNTTTLNGGNPWYGNDGESAGGFYVDGGRNIVFDGNRSTGNDIGFEFASEHPGKSTDEILMINNYISNNLSSGLNMGGYSADPNGEGGGSAENLYIYNNSFYNNWDWGTEITFAYRIINAEIHNNIIVGPADVDDNFYAPPNGQSVNINWGKNIWWGTSTFGQASLPGTTIISDPLYNDPGNNDLDIASNSPAKDAGIVQPNITSWTSTFWMGVVSAHGTTDINGTNRIVNNLIDIGADEYSSTNCPDDYALINNNHLTGTQITSQHFETDGVIDSEQQVSGSVIVSYDSNISITLLEGFSVRTPATFKAYIDGCGGL